MVSVSRVHWLAPASMLAALVAGIIFALSHHIFYSNLDGAATPSGTYSFAGVSKQQINTAIGTALAFATKACLVVAVSTAWVQLFWSALKTRSPRGVLTLGDTNKAYSVIHNAFMLFYPLGWWRFPLVFVLALVTWYVIPTILLCNLSPGIH